MRKIRVELEVYEDILLKETENTGTDNLEEAINQELGWLNDSGMFVSSWSFISEEGEEDSE